jgi:hypothetical protein
LVLVGQYSLSYRHTLASARDTATNGGVINCEDGGHFRGLFAETSTNSVNV